VLLPAALGRAVDAAVAGRGYPLWIGAAAVLLLAAMAAEALTVLASGTSAAVATRWLRHRLVARIVGWPPATTSRFGAGDLVTRVTAQAYDAAAPGRRWCRWRWPRRYGRRGGGARADRSVAGAGVRHRPRCWCWGCCGRSAGGCWT